MPLTDLIRYFNTADSAGDSMLFPEGERAAAWHQGLRLGSLFQPIVDLRQERIVGHQATLAARREDGAPVSGEAAYALCESAEAVVHFDRLCRTLHALNFLAQRRYAGGYLQLPIHPRHLLAVQSQHGLVYEAILMHNTGQQWDAPNGWAPLQWVSFMATLNYGHEVLAKIIAKRWTTLNEKVFKSTGKMIEKYNVVDPVAPGVGVEYPVQDGFGWSNGVYLAMKKYPGLNA